MDFQKSIKSTDNVASDKYFDSICTVLKSRFCPFSWWIDDLNELNKLFDASSNQLEIDILKKEEEINNLTDKCDSLISVFLILFKWL